MNNQYVILNNSDEEEDFENFGLSVIFVQKTDILVLQKSTYLLPSWKIKVKK